MKTVFVMFAFLLGAQGFAKGAKGPDLGKDQVKVSGHAQVTGPRGGLSCQQAEQRANVEITNNCQALGRNAYLVHKDEARCSCTTSNDMHFEKCSASAWGICQL